MESKDQAHLSDEENQDETFIEKPAILDKYKAAAAVANGKCLFSADLFVEALKLVIGQLAVGADVYTLCRNGDKFMEEEVSLVLLNPA